MKYLLLLLSLIFVSTEASATLINDSLYIWAPNGLNIRNAPDSRSDKIASLPFGKSVIKLSDTEHPYNITALDLSNPDNSIATDTHPLILYGQWVKVMTAEGIVGYTINQYLLPFKPRLGHYESLLPIAYTNIDTLRRNQDSLSPLSAPFNLVVSYPNDIKAYNLYSVKSATAQVKIPEISLQEAYVMLSAKLYGIRIEKNWRNEIVLYSEICSYTLTREGTSIFIEEECSC